MNRFERWFLKRVIAREVRQGNHEPRIIELYSMIRRACDSEFFEDNIPTMDSFLQECFDKTQKGLTVKSESYKL